LSIVITHKFVHLNTKSAVTYSRVAVIVNHRQLHSDHSTFIKKRPLEKYKRYSKNAFLI